MDTPPPWAKLPKETDWQFALFQAFLASGYPDGVTGPHRLREVKSFAATVGVEYGLAAQHSAGSHWFARARAYDEMILEQKVQRDMSAIQRMRTSHERRLAKLAAIIDLELDKVHERASDPVVPAATVGELRQLLEFLHKQERLLHGEATEAGESAEDSEDYSDWTVDQLREALDVHDRATAEIRARRGTSH